MLEAFTTGSIFAAIGATGFFVLIFWSIVWKAWALWISARKGSKVWFIVLLVLNTGGILEILYIFLFSKTTVIEDTLDKAKDKVVDAVKN